MDFLFADKPAGVTTHTSHGGVAKSREDAGARTHDSHVNALTDKNDGFVEHLSARLDTKLFVSHRLDRETTGAICFARTREAAEKLRAAFENREVKKRYLFLTDRAASERTLDVESFIERRGAEIVSEKPTPVQHANARTKLRLLDESEGLFLWEALPETGKSHQIRLHAQDSGIPILGDSAHGGSPFPELCLHSEHILFNIAGEDVMFASPPPRWFLKRALAKDPLLARWLVAVDRRERLLRSWAADGGAQSTAADRTLRWIHSEGDPLRAEQLGGVVSLSWFSNQAPTEKERAAIEKLCTELGWKQWLLRVRRDRGGSGGRNEAEEPRTSASAPPAQWTAPENGLHFEFRAEQGLSPGLFLDQRRNRAWVREHAREKRVLNLFCYTGGFSVAAAAGGAAQVVSVDLSKAFLDWAKKNFALNGLASVPHEFRAIDSRAYLAWAKKKGLRFDLVICDPPSFSRAETGIFKIEQDLPALIRSLLDVTSPGGRVLFSTNFEGWTEPQLAARLGESLPAGAQLAPTRSPDWDFEIPGVSRNMKSVFIDRDPSN